MNPISWAVLVTVIVLVAVFLTFLYTYKADSFFDDTDDEPTHDGNVSEFANGEQRANDDRELVDDDGEPFSYTEDERDSR